MRFFCSQERLIQEEECQMFLGVLKSLKQKCSCFDTPPKRLHHIDINLDETKTIEASAQAIKRIHHNEQH